MYDEPFAICSVDPTPRAVALQLRVDVAARGEEWSYARVLTAELRGHEAPRRVMGAALQGLDETVRRYAAAGEREGPRIEFVGELRITLAYGSHEAARDARIRDAARARGVQGFRRSSFSRAEGLDVRASLRAPSREFAEIRFDRDYHWRTAEAMTLELTSRASTFSLAEWAGLLSMLELEGALAAERNAAEAL